MTSQVKDTLLHDSHKSSKPGDDVATTGRSDSHISFRICQMSQRCFFFFSGLRPVQKHMFPLAVRCLHFHMNQSLHLPLSFLTTAVYKEYRSLIEFFQHFLMCRLRPCILTGKTQKWGWALLGAFPQGLIMLTLCSTGMDSPSSGQGGVCQTPLL